MYTRKEIEKLVNDYKAIGELLIANSVANEINKLPDNVESIEINCYTPYFADGDQVSYSVNTSELVLRDKKGVEIDNNQNKIKVDKISDLLSYFEDSFYIGVFGDHVTVRFYRNGKVKKIEYENP